MRSRISQLQSPWRCARTSECYPTQTPTEEYPIWLNGINVAGRATTSAARSYTRILNDSIETLRDDLHWREFWLGAVHQQLPTRRSGSLFGDFREPELRVVIDDQHV